MTPAASTASLRPMRSDEYAAFVGDSRAAYARDLEALAGQTHAAAARKAEDDFAELLPQGLATAGHLLQVIEADGRSVGRLWLAEREMGGRRVLYIYEIAIEPEHQGRGYGRAAMRLVEDEAARRGIARIELNVFGGNDVARGLYRTLGYVETSVQMAKDLR